MAQPQVDIGSQGTSAPPAGRPVVLAPTDRTVQGASAPRRVLVVAPQPFYEDRGTCIAVRQVVQALGMLGYDTDLLTYPVGQPVDIPGVRVHRAANPLGIQRVPVGFSSRKLVLDTLLVAQLATMLRQAPYTLIHAVEEAAFPAVVLGRHYGIPVLYDMQSSLPDQMRSHRLFRHAAAQRCLRRCERWLLEQADLVVGSLGLAERVRRMAPNARVEEWQFPSEPPAVTAEAVRELRRELGLPSDARVVLYSGTFEPYQGLSELLVAFADVRSAVPAARLVLVGGSGPSRDDLASQAAELGLRDSVRLVERQPREAVPRFLALADVLVSTRAYGENAPLKVFDYLSAGKPIVATNPACHRWVLGPDRALLVTHAPRDIANALVLVLQDRMLAKRLSAGARQFAAAHLEQEGFVQRLASIYDEAVARAGAARATT